MTSVYIGPYVRCTVTTEPKLVIVRTCTNTQCVNQQKDYPLSTRFCPLCGSPVGNVGHFDDQETVDVRQLREIIEERLVQPSDYDYYEWKREQHAHIWVPNVSYGVERNTHLVDFGFEVTDILPKGIETEVLRFLSAFEDDIKVLKDAYGQHATTYHWGIIQGD